MRRITCVITISALQKLQIDAVPWEVPILKMVHGDQVVEIGEARCDLRVPEPEHEYMRLERRFGRNKETLVPRVVELYGAGVAGVMNLTRAMQLDLDEQAELDATAAKEAEAAAKQAAKDAKKGEATAAK